MRPIAQLCSFINAFLLLINLGSKQLLLTPAAVDGACLTYWADASAARKYLNYEPIFSPLVAFHRTLAYYRHHPEFPPGYFPIPSPCSLRPVACPSNRIICGSRERLCLIIRNFIIASLMLLLLMRCSFVVHTQWQSLPVVPAADDQHKVFALLTDFRSNSFDQTVAFSKQFFSQNNCFSENKSFLKTNLSKIQLLPPNTHTLPPLFPTVNTPFGILSRGLFRLSNPARPPRSLSVVALSFTFTWTCRSELAQKI
jgi:hypothetical protein